MTVAHLGDSSSFISNKPSHSSVGPASQQLPSQVRYGLQFFQGPGRKTTITPITQRGKLRHRKTQYRCVESGFKSRPATVSRKKSHCPSQACLCCWVGDPSSVLLSQPQGTPHISNCRPHSGTVMRDGRDLAGPLGPCIHPVIHHIPASWRLASQRPRSLEALQAPYACLGSPASSSRRTSGDFSVPWSPHCTGPSLSSPLGPRRDTQPYPTPWNSST